MVWQYSGPNFYVSSYGIHSVKCEYPDGSTFLMPGERLTPYKKLDPEIILSKKHIYRLVNGGFAPIADAEKEAVLPHFLEALEKWNTVVEWRE